MMPMKNVTLAMLHTISLTGISALWSVILIATVMHMMNSKSVRNAFQECIQIALGVHLLSSLSAIKMIRIA